MTESPWLSPADVTVADGDSHEPAIACANGVTHLVWSKNKLLHHARLTDGVWQPPVRFAVGEEPVLAVTADGVLHCVYSSWFLGNQEVYYTRFEGDKWGLSEWVSRTKGESSQPAICITPGGLGVRAVHIAWADTTPGRTTIYYAHRGDVAWLHGPVFSAIGTRPALGAAGDGKVYLAWQQRLMDAKDNVPVQGPYQILASILTEGKWSLPEVVSEHRDCHAVCPSLAVNAAGFAHLVWEEERERMFVIRHADRRPGSWSMPDDVSESGRDGRLPRIIGSPTGMFQVLWSEDASLRHRARAEGYEAVWGAAETACEGCPDISELAAALAPGGELHMVWSTYTTSTARSLHYMRRRPLVKQKIFIPMVPG